MTIYQDPLTEQHEEGEAQPLRCLDGEVGWHDGRILQRWQVRFRGERRVVERLFLVELLPDGTPVVQQSWQWPCGHQGRVRVLLLGTHELAGSEADHCPQCETTPPTD